MGYQDHDHFEPVPDHDALGTLRAAISIGVRLLGVALVLVGLWGALQVILEGWSLYREPARIERLATAVEQGSHLDAVFAPVAAETAQEGDAAPVTPRAGATLRLSYFAAWFIALMLLAVIGALAMAAFATGGRLALGGDGMGEMRRAVVRELRALRRAA